MRVLGIDPGIQRTGYAVLERTGSSVRVHEAGVISTTTRAELPERLVEIDTHLESILAEHRPELVAVESLYAHYRHPRTAILMGHARGIVLLAAARHGLAVHDLAATQVKQSVTGNGRASKVQVQRAVQICLELAEPPSPPDVADACAVALTALQMLVVGGRR